MGWGRLAAASLPLSSRRWPTGERLTACCIMKITTLRNPERAGSSSRALFLCYLSDLLQRPRRVNGVVGPVSDPGRNMNSQERHPSLSDGSRETAVLVIIGEATAPDVA